ncbi:hypothetical protein [Hymenobacter sp.]|uniref:hypothetical protein n=1 Tax=Hymenobacter sp. TaxID=1898978 RepID=UPI002ED8E434
MLTLQQLMPSGFDALESGKLSIVLNDVVVELKNERGMQPMRIPRAKKISNVAKRLEKQVTKRLNG